MTTPQPQSTARCHIFRATAALNIPCFWMWNARTTLTGIDGSATNVASRVDEFVHHDSQRIAEDQRMT